MHRYVDVHQVVRVFLDEILKRALDQRNPALVPGIPDALLSKTDGVSVAIDTELTDDLVVEGVAREVVKAIQALRRDQGLDVSDRIELTWSSDAAQVSAAMADHGAWIAAETLATNVVEGDGDEVEIADGLRMRLRVSPAG